MESVHLVEWPKYKIDTAAEKSVIDMAEARKIVTVALQERAKANIKVRQPLAKLSIKNASLGTELFAVIKDEVNVKEVVVDATLVTDTLLDTAVDENLRKEGVARDVIRAIQDLRKTEGLTVGDKVTLLLDSDEKGKELVRAHLADVKRVTLVIGVEYAHLPNATALEVEGYSFKLGFKK